MPNPTRNKMNHSAIPAVIIEYDGQKATVKPMVQILYLDGSSLPVPEITDVPVLTPTTAYAGLKIPIKVGDKVMVHVSDRDIQDLLFKQSTAGLDTDISSVPKTKRVNNLTDAIAYAGFQSLDDMIPSDDDVWIFNNRGSSGSYNYIKLRADGSIISETSGVTVTQTASGTLSIQADNNVNITTPLTTITGNVAIYGDVDCYGEGGADTNFRVRGYITATEEVTADGIELSTHVHGGVDRGSSNTDGPQ